MMYALLVVAISFSIGRWCTPTTYRGEPLLTVLIVKAMKSKNFKWLAWRVPFTKDATWHYKRVEKRLKNWSK